MRFDHLVVAAETLEAGVAHVEAALGVALPQAVGRHARMGTMNRLLSLGGTEYLEVIACDPAAAPPPQPRWFALDGFSGPPRLHAWVCASDGLERELLPGAGVPLAFARGPFRWRMAVPADGRLPLAGLQPAQIAWEGPHPAPLLPESGCRLARLSLASPDAPALAARLGALADPRLGIEPGPSPRIRAGIVTPAGLRVLE